MITMEGFEKGFSRITSLLGDKARSTMLWYLLDGRAYTATELAMCADISAQSASNHLSKMVNANMLIVKKQGRHRYYQYANPEIAHAIESIAGLVPVNAELKRMEKTEHSDFTQARTCYDHLAGKLGVAVTESLLQQKIIVSSNNVFEITKKGQPWFSDLGIDVNRLMQQRRSFLRPCLDWSERKYHIAGSLGAALLDLMLAEDWIRRIKKSRTVIITAKGEKNLYEYFKLTPSA
jgi:DNA-binding transcriptional ArsR family regulator